MVNFAKNLTVKLKNFCLLMIGLFIWVSPLGLFLIVTYLPKVLWNPGFDEYLEFLKILVWPYTVLIILFFFKKVVTFMFFSMDEFNFFGAKGSLRNVNEVIVEEVNKRFVEEKKEIERQKDMNHLEKEIKERESEITRARGTAEENLDIAREILSNWKRSSEQSKKSMSELDTENKRLKEMISGLPPVILEASSPPSFDGTMTSDPISEESNIS